jgi:O-acetyl-ADP-ribose deacetylase (regulator of RNase III)
VAGAGPRITYVRGDITEQDTDAIVNAANESLLGGGGVDGAIHAAAGPSVLEECRRIRATTHPAGLRPGEAVTTGAGNLAARYIIHTVGPRYREDPDPARTLAAAHTNALREADRVGAETVAFPAISTGIFGYPLDEAAKVAAYAVRNADTKVKEVRFVSFDDRTHAAFSKQ